MKNEQSRKCKKWRFLLLSFLLLAFTTTKDTKSEYNVARAAYSITTGDIDLDGDQDIIIGHIYNSQTEWSGISTLINNGKGEFIVDSSYLYGGHTDIIITNTNNYSMPDIVTQGQIGENAAISVITDYTEDIFEVNNFILDYIPHFISTGDINGDNKVDLVFTSNFNKIWGILYNDGLDNFLEPEYYNLDFPPICITCGDFDNNGKDDVVVAGETKIFFPTSSGFDTLSVDAYTECVETVDFDNDGDLDIIGATGMFVGYTRLHLIENKGNKEFHIHGPIDIPHLSNLYFSIADFNKDLLPDLLFNPIDNEPLMIIYNNGDFSLSEPKMLLMDDYGESYRRSASVMSMMY